MKINGKALKINENHWKTMKINEKSMKMHVNQWKSIENQLKINENQ